MGPTLWDAVRECQVFPDYSPVFWHLGVRVLATASLGPRAEAPDSKVAHSHYVLGTVVVSGYIVRT